jgi:hypothetical protein
MILKKIGVILVVSLLTCSYAMADRVTKMQDNFAGIDNNLNDNTGNVNWIHAGGADVFKVNEVLYTSGAGNATTLFNRDAVILPKNANEKLVITFKNVAWATSSNLGNYWRIYISKDTTNTFPLFYFQQTDYVDQNGDFIIYSQIGTVPQLNVFENFDTGNVGSGGSYRIEIDTTNVKVWFSATQTIPDGTGSALYTVAHSQDFTDIAQWTNGTGAVSFYYPPVTVYTSWDDFSVLLYRNNLPVLDGNFNGDNKVDFADFVYFAEDWLTCYNPADVACN